ncbi:HlyD family secretion protein [mine drainage metagenome]|uniref:HlyD family secretion protein n=1 Tax=mine drainage metagenome TaxID=410659 RepID=A0A1J5Q9X5_9ZZZZ
MLDDARNARQGALAGVSAAQASVEMQAATLERAKAQLVGPASSAAPSEMACCVQLRAPVSGTVLAVDNLSARPVQPGEHLMTIGDLKDLEIEVDVLSSDAVQIVDGALARIDRWGGDHLIEARVRQIDPAAYTKISALGIEEQRLRLDILTPPDQRAGLGDNYRVFVRIVTWSGNSVLQVPISALFRDAGHWAIFRVVSGRAVLTPVEIGNQTSLQTEVVSGLSEGDRVVELPGNKVQDGTRITAREKAPASTF